MEVLGIIFSNIYCSIPYKKDIFGKLKYVFKKRNIAYRQNAHFEKEVFLKDKDKVPLENRSGIVYNVECGCGDQDYIDQTCQQYCIVH